MSYRLIYASAAQHLLDARELEEILTVARRNNARRGISGMLLYRAGSFIQLLEGSKEAVSDLFATIEADPRHRSVMVLDQRAVDAPALPDWSMGYREVGDDDGGAGLFELSGQAIDRRLADAPRAILRFMRNFYAINRG
jgi:hypothetical protein